MRFTIGLVAAIGITATLLAQAPPPPAPQGPPAADQEPAGPPDEAGRPVARIGVLSGEASVRRGDSSDWVAAALNAPLMTGDAISVNPGGAVELQLDRANFARFAGDSEGRIANMDNGAYTLQLSKGLVTWRVLRQASTRAEIQTPLAAVRTIGMAGVRVEIAPDGAARVTVRHGEVDVDSKRGSERLREGNTMLIRGTADDPEFQIVAAPVRDGWDDWSDQRDTYLQRAQSPQYVSQDIYGAEDLDNYGRWSNDPQYGNVWTPTVPAGWAPYRNGQWVWEDYYGWTWVDYSPWGWAPFHYGSWYWRVGFGWSWFPGHRYERFFWRPALVGFVGFGHGIGVGFGFGNVGWIPLAPYERFYPWYGRGGWGRPYGGAGIVNVNVTAVFRNARIGNGVTAVSAADFQHGNFRNPVAVGASIQSASLVRGAAPIAPTERNLQFNDRNVAARPGSASLNSRFYSRNPVPAASTFRTPFNQQQASVRSAIEGHASGPGQGFGNAAGSASWQRFGQTAPSAAGGRSLNVAPPIVHQREAGPAPGGSPGARFGAPTYNSPAPAYRPAPAAPSYRPAPAAPSYRPAPAPSGGHASAPAAHSGGGGVSHGGGGSGHSRK